jgi:hypothetical protein
MFSGDAKNGQMSLNVVQDFSKKSLVKNFTIGQFPGSVLAPP